MIFLKKLWIEHLTKNLENNRAQAHPVDFSKSSKIGVLFTENIKENQNNIDNIIHDLKSEGKEITTLAFCKNKNLSIQKYPIFGSKDVGFFGGFKSEIVSEFINQKFDFVVCLDKKMGTSMQYLLSQLQTRCRVGIHNHKTNDHFELIIRTDDSSEPTSRDVLKYLKMIQSNEH